MKTYNLKAQDIKRNWYIIDATDKVLGRLATKVATLLRGKHKPEYTPYLDTGDNVVIVNAKNIRVTGNKENDKIYYHHSGYPGGIKQQSFKELMNKNPTEVIEKAIRGMLPKGPLGRQMLRKLKVYSGTEHPHIAQQPQILEIEE